MKKEKDTREKKEKSRFLERRKESINSFGSDFMSTIREVFNGKKTITKTNEIFQEIYRFNEKKEEKHSRYSTKEWISFIGLGLTILNIITLIICYGVKFSALSEKILSTSIIYMLVAVVAPFWVWAIATNENFWAFHQRKRVFFYLCCLNLFLVLMQPLYGITRNLILKAVTAIKPDEVLTVNMLLLLAYIGILITMSIICIIIYTQLEPLITSQALRRQIELFKLSHVVDSREDRDYKYDITTIKDLETGKPIVVKENDRMNQAEINGASGTGKTSSIFLPVIEKDADQKVINQEKRLEEIAKMIRERKATLRGPLREFNENAVIAIGKTKADLENNKKLLAKIKKKYSDCGMTIIAPNPSLMEEIIKLCRARKIKVNVLDPMHDYSHFENVRTVGINPFYVPLGLSEEERVIYISQAATVFAEVLIATNQMNGAASDVYFTDISLSVSSNIAAVVMLAKNISGEQAYIDDVQNCISNFQNIQDYITIINNHYNIRVGAASMAPPKKATSEDYKDAMEEARKKADTGTKYNEIKDNPYYQQLLFVSQELLGSGSEDMFSQARGLRNLINKVMQDPRIKTKLSEESSEHLLDFDKILSENQITVVNTAIELGKSASTAFGLFFILLHKVSVLRRPMETRTPHFLWIDEASQYMHPCYEDMISLYRQYRCAVIITLQSLTQTEKSSATAYLKNVFLGAGTHIVFGRLSAEEMKLYSEMSGIVRENVDQTSYTTSSILATEPGYTESVRSTPSITTILEGSDMRLLDFQELTIFTINNGRVLPGQLARVFFLNKEAFVEREIKEFPWEQLAPEAFKEQTGPEGDAQKKRVAAHSGAPKVEMEIPEEERVVVMKQTTKGTERIETGEKTPEVEIDYDSLSAQELFALLQGKMPVRVSPEEEESDKSDKKEQSEGEKKEESPQDKPKEPTAQASGSPTSAAAGTGADNIPPDELKSKLDEFDYK